MKLRRDENGLSINGHWKRGFFSFLFSPTFLSILSILLELIVLGAVWYYLGEVLAMYLVGFRTGLVLLFSLIIINSKMESSAKLTWLFFIALFVYIGVLFFLMSKIGSYRKTRRKLRAEYEKNNNLHPQNDETLVNLEKVDHDSYLMANYLYEAHHYPVYQNTSVKYYPLGENKFEDLLKDLENAKEFIFLEYFIIEEGYMWGHMLDILERKAREGVDVRVIYDGTCSMSNLRAHYYKRLQKIGIQAKIWNRIKPHFSSTLNYRDHRKILVIDNKIAYNGGVNLADEYINRKKRFGHWKDTAVRLEGEAVSRFTTMFLANWYAEDYKHGPIDFSPYLKNHHSVPSDGFVIPYATNPLEHEKIAEMVYFNLINTAKDYIHIITPYLVLDDELRTALRVAAMKKVDVRIIVPGIPDKKNVWFLAKAHYRRLLDAGVHIYEYTPGFTHAKVFVSDHQKGVVGTINLDYRSLYHHFECATYLSNNSCIKDIDKDFDETMAKSHEITYEDVKKNSLWRKFMGAVMRLIAPLL